MPYLTTKEGVNIIEREEFILKYSGFTADDFKRVFDNQNTINENLGVNFNSQEISDKFFGPNIKIEGHTDGDGVYFIFEDGGGVSLDKNGLMKVFNNTGAFIKSPLSNNDFIEKVDINTLSHLEILSFLKNDIPVQVEAENNIMSALQKLSKARWNFDVSQKDLNTMLHNKTINDVLSGEWAKEKGFLVRKGWLQIAEDIKNWFEESSITLTDEEKSKTVGEILSKYALRLKLK